MKLRKVGRSVGNAVLQRLGRAASKAQEAKPLPADVLESDDAYLVVFDVPGATQGDVQVRYTGGRVVVRVDRFREFRDGYEMVFPGRGLALDGEASLPSDALVEPESASATLLSNGVLQVRVPKRASGEPADDGGRASVMPETGS